MISNITLGRFVAAEERKHSGPSELSELLSSVALGVKYISNLVATAGFKGLTGYTGKVNVQGESTQVLDEQSDEVLIEILGSSGHVGLMVSEERDTIVPASVHRDSAKYVIA